IDPAEPVDGIDLPEPVDGAAAVAPSPDGTGSTEYRIALLAGAGNPDGGERFVSFVVSADGRRIMAANGFGRP
ncbi:MAG: substrate-binding domain-containing protein, partial [Acidimicrobiales bacterium]